jgi:hypothetical protein
VVRVLESGVANGQPTCHNPRGLATAGGWGCQSVGICHRATLLKSLVQGPGPSQAGLVQRATSSKPYSQRVIGAALAHHAPTISNPTNTLQPWRGGAFGAADTQCSDQSQVRWASEGRLGFCVCSCINRCMGASGDRKVDWASHTAHTPAPHWQRAVVLAPGARPISSTPSPSRIGGCPLPCPDPAATPCGKAQHSRSSKPAHSRCAARQPTGLTWPGLAHTCTLRTITDSPPTEPDATAISRGI